jgi:hypothetical protein
MAKTIRVFNVGSRTFLEVADGEDGKPKHLNPGRSLELPAAKAMSMMEAYPREIKSAEAVAEDPNGMDLTSRERAIAKREAELDAREAELDDREGGKTTNLESMSKAELVEYAGERNISVDPSAKKSDIIDAIEVQGE